MTRSTWVMLALLVALLAERGAEAMYHLGWRAGWHDAVQVLQADSPSPGASL